MRWVIVAAACALPGCTSVFGLEDPLRVDAAVVVDVDAPPGCQSFSTLVDTCQLTFTTEARVDGSFTFDSDTKRWEENDMVMALDVTGPAGPFVVVPLAALTIEKGKSLRVVGSKPVAFVVDGMVTINGMLTVAAGGAGHRTCDAMAGADGSSGAGGGGGGGYGGAGGAGGDGAQLGGSAGMMSLRPAGLLGGCAGARGGNGSNQGGAPGLGGGAIAVVARARLRSPPRERSMRAARVVAARPGRSRPATRAAAGAARAA